jgi:hypothetical protein
MEIGPVFLFLLFGIFAVVVIVLGLYFSAKRRKELEAIANRLGFKFYPGGSFDFEDQYRFFELFQRGGSRRSYNLIAGRDGEIDVKLFDYRYSTGSGKNRTTHNRSACILDIPVRYGFPYMIIRPEGFFDKFASIVGFNDIDFESVEFSKKYYVKGKDRRFAYDVVHPRMMEFLLEVGGVFIELGNRSVLVHHNRRLSPGYWPGLLRLGMRFVELVPERLFAGEY